MPPAQACPKSDEAVRTAVKPGAVVIGLGRAAVPIADALRAALGHRVRPGDNWEESRVNHLIIVVECLAMNGDCCEAANKFMRDVRKSDGYPVYSAIIGRKVAVLALGKAQGAAKVEEVLLKRGGCSRLLAPPSVGCLSDGAAVSELPWTIAVSKALDAITTETHGGWPEDVPDKPAPPPTTTAPVPATKQPIAPAPVPLTDPLAVPQVDEATPTHTWSSSWLPAIMLVGVGVAAAALVGLQVVQVARTRRG